MSQKACVLLSISIAVKRHHDQGSSYKRTTFNCSWLTGSVQYHLWEHGSFQAGMAHKMLWVLHPILKVNRRRSASRQLGEGSQSPPPKWHTSSNKATPPNSATPWAKHIQTTTTMIQFSASTWQITPVWIQHHHTDIRAGKTPMHIYKKFMCVSVLTK